MSSGRSLEEFASGPSDDTSPREVAFFALLGAVAFFGLIVLVRWCLVPVARYRREYFTGRVRVAYARLSERVVL